MQISVPSCQNHYTRAIPKIGATIGGTQGTDGYDCERGNTPSMTDQPLALQLI